MRLFKELALEKKLRLFLTMTLRAYNVPKEEMEQVLAFVAGLDIRSIAERVMQELFKMLAMHYEFSLAGIEEATTTDLKTADAGKAIQLGTGSITGYAATNSYDCIYFGNWTCTKYSAAVPGPIKWRVLDTKTNMENAVDGDGLFLLSDGLYGIDDAGWIFFSRSNNAWQGSEAQEWCKIFAGEADATETIPHAFTAGELSAILSTYKDDGEVVISEIYTFLASKQILNGDKVFFLSAEEAVNDRYGFSAGYEDSDNITRVAYFGEKTYSWWLRSPYRNDAGSNTDAGWVSETGYISMEGPNRISPARPAFNLDPDSVLFISAAEGGKHADGMDSGLTAVSDFAGSEWKLTLKDSTRSEFSAELESRTDSTVVVSYTGASAGTNEYVSAMVKNGDTVKYYGRIAGVSAADGTVTILLPDDFSAAAGDKLYVFNEQYNGEKQTDYASELAEIQLDGSHTHCFCGGDVTAGDHTSHTDVTYQEWNGTDSITYDENGTAYVYLTDNAQFALDLDIDNGQTLYLCLNGKEYKCIDYGKINVNPGGCLYLCDCQGTGKIVGNDLISSRFGSGCINITGYYDQKEEPATGYIFGGTITGGVAKQHGGGIFVENNCILSIYGGTITGNRAMWYGGGVHVMSYSVVNLYGGTITGNTTDRICGGMFVAADSELNISGAPVVEGNTDGEGACNILLADPSAKQINFAGEMTEGAKLGITVTTFSDERVYPAVFSSACDTDYSSYFFADNKEIHVEYNSDKKLQLAEEAKPHTHVWSTEWDSDDTHHWHNCTADGCDITDNSQKDGYAAHSGEDDGDCTTAVDCKTCSYQIKNAESAHNYPDTWTAVRPGSTHTRKCRNEGCDIAITNSCISDKKATCQEFAKCTICGGDCGTKTDHDFTAEKAEEEYLETAATCTTKAIYYKSCSVCGLSSQGMTGEDTFESGEFDANNHTGNLSDWQYNANGHWKEYSCCHAQPDAGTHNYDNETDIDCNICGYQRTITPVHTHSWADTWSSNDTYHWHECTADGCDITDNSQKDGYAAHSGEDDGDCTTAVDCKTCNYQIKNAESAHNYPDTWTAVRPGSTHTRKCQNEGCNIAITNSCVSDGKATCQDFAKCTICGGDCGTKADHDFTAETMGEDYLKSAATCTAKAVYYKSCSVCGLSSQGTADEATFESGEFDANSHTGNLSDWQYNANGHWKEYSCCHAQPYAGTHVYDNETDIDCNTCGYQRTVLYNITFNANGGTLSGENTAQTNANGTLASLPTPDLRRGYRFDGWYTEAEGGTKITVKTVFEANTTVYAHWTYTGGSSGSYTPGYTVTVEKSTNGTVSADRKTASRGATVTITVTPDEGYVLETLTVTDKDGNELKLTDKGGGKYTFTMPDSSVTVKATFMDDNTMLNFFVDVKASDYFYDAVLWAAQKGITSGTDDTHFSPNEPCTRAQIVTFLWRAAGSPVVNYAMNMTDVPEDAYYAEPVRWALSEGITTGTTETTFSPDETCTRAQAVAFLFRYAAPEAVTLQELVSGFSDAASVPGYALSAMNWALASGIVQGDGSSLMPNDSCTRAQIVTFLYRALEK